MGLVILVDIVLCGIPSNGGFSTTERNRFAMKELDPEEIRKRPARTFRREVYHSLVQIQFGTSMDIINSRWF